MIQQDQKIIIIAGPNGAGKTTFARAFLPFEADCMVFINADLIAAGIAPFAPETAAFAAGRMMLSLIDKHFKTGDSFAFETTLSGRAYMQSIDRWRRAGYRVELIFLALPSAEMAQARVAQRVKQGGHFVPADVIDRRYASGWANFHAHYKHAVDAWTLVDASDSDCKILDWKEK